MKKIICVCTENTCRSPMLEAILKKKLKDVGVKNIKVDSAGIYVREGLYIDPNSKKVINEHGLRIGNRKSKQLKSTMINQDTLLLTVSDAHKQFLRNVEKIISLNEFQGGRNIPDVYGKGIDVYRYCYDLMEDIVDQVVKSIKNKELIW